MSILIYKPKGAAVQPKDIYNGIVPRNPYYISLVYAENGQIFIGKFSKSKGNLDDAWMQLSYLTPENVLIFFHRGKEKIYNRNEENLPPVLITEDLAYISSGEILSLNKQDKKKFSDTFVFKGFAFEEMARKIPGVFFSEAGKWLINQTIPFTSAMAFINSQGDVSLINASWWYIEKELHIFSPEAVRAHIAEAKAKAAKTN